MTVSVIEKSSALPPAQAFATPVREAERPAPARAADTSSVTVSVSDTGQQAAALISDLPPLILDPEIHMKNAQDRLKIVMQDLGIPPGTEIDFSVNSNGKISVEGDHEKLAELEDMLNSGEEFDLRNSLIGAHTSSVIQRIAGVVDMAARAADETPSRADAYFGWARQQADQIKSARLDLTFDGSALDGELRNANGSKMTAIEDLRLPA